MIDNNTWYDVVLEIDNQIPSVRFFVKKSDGGEYELVKADAPYQNYIPSKLVMGFDSGAGSIVFDNFKFYGSSAADNDTEVLLDYEMALATGLYDINNIIASPTLTRGTDNYVDVTDYVKSQINDPDVWKNEDGTIDVVFKLSHCTGKAIIIEGASSALVAERSFAESNVAVRTLDENGNETSSPEGAVTAKANVFVNGLEGEKTLYLGVYDKNGALVSVASETADLGTMGESAEISVSADAGTGNTVKAFFWDDRMVPVK